ncbi:MAG TPA: tetratricopeptide repeat protein [Planktothrix sp.]|jgi:tetratricopeptide (TPR) repeat protein
MRKSTIIYTLSVTTAFSLYLSANSAYAAPSNANPSTQARTASKDFTDNDDSETIIPATATRFNRRHDYREDDKQKKEADAQAKKDAADNAKKAQQAAVDNAGKAQQIAIDSNNQAVALGKQGRWEEAIAAHEKAIQYDPRNKQFRINLSAAYAAYGQERLAKNDLTSAVSQFRKSLAAASDNGLAGRCLVQCLKKMGYDPSNPDVRLQLGDQLAATGDMAGASVEYTAAMQLEPSARTYVKMGDMAYRYGQSGQALNWYRQAIVKDPESAAAHRQLGFLQMAQRDYTAAAASLRQALILDSKDAAAGQALEDLWRRQVAANPLLAENHLGLAGALQLTGDFVGAESEYRKVQELDPKNSGLEAGRASLARAYEHARAEKHKLAAETLFNQGLRREALAEINQAVTAEPRNANYQYLLGECLEAVGDYQNAHQAYLTCVLIDPENNKEAAARIRMMEQQGAVSNAGAVRNINQIGNQMSRQPQAVSSGTAGAAPNVQNYNPQSIGNQSQHAAPQSSTTAGAPAAGADASAINDGLSRVTDAESQKDYNTAISILRELSTSNLQNSEIHHRLAVNLLAAGQIDDSIAEFRISSALRPDKKIYSDDLARALAIKKAGAQTSESVTAAAEPKHGEEPSGTSLLRDGALNNKPLMSAADGLMGANK